MAKRQKEWARRARLALLTELGNRCVYCGSTSALTFDCINPRGDTHHRLDTARRISFYRREHYQEKNLQIACEKCNAKKGDKSAHDFFPLWRLEEDQRTIDCVQGGFCVGDDARDHRNENNSPF